MPNKVQVYATGVDLLNMIPVSALLGLILMKVRYLKKNKHKMFQGFEFVDHCLKEVLLSPRTSNSLTWRCIWVYKNPFWFSYTESWEPLQEPGSQVLTNLNLGVLYQWTAQWSRGSGRKGRVGNFLPIFLTLLFALPSSTCDRGNRAMLSIQNWWHFENLMFW